MKTTDFLDRKFKLWFYQISHSEAIIRSPKTDSNKIYGTNIDIYLGDIDYIEIPWIFNGLKIEQATEEDALYLCKRLGKDIAYDKIVVLVTEGQRYYVVASILEIMENDLEYGVLPIYAFLENKEE